MPLWITAVVTLALASLGVVIIRRLSSLSARGWWLSGLGVLANILYTVVALYPLRPYDLESSLLVLAALPIGFIAQTVGAILCVKAIIQAPGAGDIRERLVLAANVLVLLASLMVLVMLGDGFYLLAAVPGGCLVTFTLFCIYYALQRAEQQA
jgi:hypothetical protein